jgi:hypothetical protein
MSETATSTLMAEAKKSWFEKFNGPAFVLEKTIGSSLVENFYRRTFEITSRNAHFISVFGRILLGEDKVKEPEDYLKTTLANAIKDLDNKIATVKALMLNDGIEKLATYENSRPVQVKIVSPIAKQYFELLMKAEEYQTYVSTLWLHGSLDDRQRTGSELELKKKLRSVVNAARNMFIVIRKKTQEKNGAAVVAKIETESSAEQGEGAVAKPKAKVKSDQVVGDSVAPAVETTAPDEKIAEQQAA